ncbi:MAG: hypothetical protein AB1705_00430 [Verrucomicrobiota bacterium]
MFIYRSRFLTRAEAWYDDEPSDFRSVDWVLYRLRSCPVPGAKCRDFHNCVIDLAQTVGELKARLHDDTAYKIRRARDRDKIRCECCDPNDPAVLDRFEEMYNAFAPTKGLSPLDRARLNGMAAAGVLDLSVARDSQGKALVFHGNYRDHQRASQLHSPSLYPGLSDSATRNMIGRANRYLFWNDILRYKEAGLTRFDFGGWYAGTTDAALLRINEFKRGFGGEVRREFEGEQIVTLKGWLVLTVAGLLNRAKLLSSGSKAPVTQPAAANNHEPAAAV